MATVFKNYENSKVCVIFETWSIPPSLNVFRSKLAKLKIFAKMAIFYLTTEDISIFEIICNRSWKYGWAENENVKTKKLIQLR